MRITAEEAYELSRQATINAPAHVLGPVYEKIYKAALRGERSAFVTYPESKLNDYWLATSKLRRDGYRVCPVDPEDPHNRGRVIHW
jgi:hypothetical protein